MNSKILEVRSPNVKYSEEYIESKYAYQTTDVKEEDGVVVAEPRETTYTFRTQKAVPRLGVMLVGWGGNNGSTVTAAILANKLGMSWPTKDGVQKANYFGSITQASTVFIGTSAEGSSIYLPLKDLLPMTNPNDIVLDGKLF